MDTAAAILNLPVPPMSRYRPDVPEILEHIVSKMLAKEPAERYQLVHEVRTDLARVDARPGPIEERAPVLRLPAFGKKRRRFASAAFAVAALVAALAFWPDRPFGPSTEGPPSVAVLPLTNISDEPLESDYLADGISPSRYHQADPSRPARDSMGDIPALPRQQLRRGHHRAGAERGRRARRNFPNRRGSDSHQSVFGGCPE